MTEEHEINEKSKKLAAECEVLKKRLEDALNSNAALKKENCDLKAKMANSLTPEQIQRLRNDNKRLLGITERINSQRSRIEENLKDKKQDITDLENELTNTKEKLENVITDRNKIKALVENLLNEIEKLREEIKVLKEGKSFADFVELKRQIKELKDENMVLSQGLTSDQKGLKLNLNDLATMLHMKEGDALESISHRNQNQRVVVLDERELEESVKKHVADDQRPPCCQESPPRTPQNNRPLTSRNSVNRINFISPPCSLATTPRTYSRQASRERRISKSAETALPGNGPTENHVIVRRRRVPKWPSIGKLNALVQDTTLHNHRVGPGTVQTHFIVRRRSSPRWPSLSELNERYQFALQGAWTTKPTVEEVIDYMKKRQSTNSLNNNS